MEGEAIIIGEKGTIPKCFHNKRYNKCTECEPEVSFQRTAYCYHVLV